MSSDKTFLSQLWHEHQYYHQLTPYLYIHTHICICCLLLIKACIHAHCHKLCKNMWKSSRSKSVKLGQNYNQTEYEHPSNQKWLMFWRRIKRAKKKVAESPSGMQNTYDPQSYLQNFDEGSETSEPENLYRSFSARYANPSRFNHRNLNEFWVMVIGLCLCSFLPFLWLLFCV